VSASDMATTISTLSGSLILNVDTGKVAHYASATSGWRPSLRQPSSPWSGQPNR